MELKNPGLELFVSLAGVNEDKDILELAIKDDVAATLTAEVGAALKANCVAGTLELMEKGTAVGLGSLTVKAKAGCPDILLDPATIFLADEPRSSVFSGELLAGEIGSYTGALIGLMVGVDDTSTEIEPDFPFCGCTGLKLESVCLIEDTA